MATRRRSLRGLGAASSIHYERLQKAINRRDGALRDVLNAPSCALSVKAYGEFMRYRGTADAHRNALSEREEARVGHIDTGAATLREMKRKLSDLCSFSSVDLNGLGRKLARRRKARR